MRWALTLYMLNFEEGTKTYLHFMAFLHNDMTQVVEIPPQVKQGPSYSTSCTWSLLWLLMPWRCEEPGHQQQ